MWPVTVKGLGRLKHNCVRVITLHHSNAVSPTWLRLFILLCQCITSWWKTTTMSRLPPLLLDASVSAEILQWFITPACVITNKHTRNACILISKAMFGDSDTQWCHVGLCLFPLSCTDLNFCWHRLLYFLSKKRWFRCHASCLLWLMYKQNF